MLGYDRKKNNSVDTKGSHTQSTITTLRVGEPYSFEYSTFKTASLALGQLLDDLIGARSQSI